jgi:hypothetical protein
MPSGLQRLAAEAGAATHGTGLTGAPGRIFWKPSTMI